MRTVALLLLSLAVLASCRNATVPETLGQAHAIAGPPYIVEAPSVLRAGDGSITLRFNAPLGLEGIALRLEMDTDGNAGTGERLGIGLPGTDIGSDARLERGTDGAWSLTVGTFSAPVEVEAFGSIHHRVRMPAAIAQHEAGGWPWVLLAFQLDDAGYYVYTGRVLDLSRRRGVMELSAARSLR